MPNPSYTTSVCFVLLLSSGVVFAQEDSTCALVTDATRYARVDVSVTDLLSRRAPEDRQTPAGRLSRGDLVRVMGQSSDHVIVQAPITDSQDSYLVASKDLCAASDSLELDPDRYPLPRSNLDEQMLNMMALYNVPAELVAQTTVEHVSTPDMAGNPIPATFKVAKWYARLGRALSNAVGWYDYVQVKYVAFEAGAFSPTDLGEGPALELRQGHDSASRQLLSLRDPDQSGLPFVLYAGSNSDNRTLFAMIPHAGGQWITYRCARRGVSVIRTSQISYQGVRPELTQAARHVCSASP